MPGDDFRSTKQTCHLARMNGVSMAGFCVKVERPLRSFFLSKDSLILRIGCRLTSMSMQQKATVRIFWPRGIHKCTLRVRCAISGAVYMKYQYMHSQNRWRGLNFGQEHHVATGLVIIAPHHATVADEPGALCRQGSDIQFSRRAGIVD
jgi:hypothetical protein